jgi:ferredoxin
MKRKIVRIDEEKCNGCGQCIPSCAEGAIELVDGKARLVSDVYCDGLGACLGECPQDAITIEEREAGAFDEEAVAERLKALKDNRTAEQAAPEPEAEPMACGCPGSMARDLRADAGRGGCPGAARGELAREKPAADRRAPRESGAVVKSELVNWPVQMKLVGTSAPYFQGADLLLVADCVPFACPDFHGRILRERPVVVGCPKLDEPDFYVEKLAAILRESGVRSLTVVHMEVPCCHALTRIARAAVSASGREVPLSDVTVGIGGEVVEEEAVGA